MHLNFAARYLSEFGHGVYTRLDPALLPPLFLAVNRNAAGKRTP